MSKNQGKKKITFNHFTESARKEIVKEIEQGLGKREASRKYGVSETSIYRWIVKYSKKYKKAQIRVVESKDEASTYKSLEKELDKAYELLGRSQTEILLLKKIIELASKEHNIDLKKSLENNQSSSSSKTIKR